MNENLFHKNITDINIIKFEDALTDVQWNDVIELMMLMHVTKTLLAHFLVYMINTF